MRSCVVAGQPRREERVFAGEYLDTESVEVVVHRLATTSCSPVGDVWGRLKTCLAVSKCHQRGRRAGDLRAGDLGLVVVVVLAAFAARAIILFLLLPLLTGLRLSPKIERPYRIAIMWGGLRGAVTLALALAVTESLRVPVETKRLVGILATGFTLFTLIVQGTTLRYVISLLGLDKLSPLDRAL